MNDKVKFCGECGEKLDSSSVFCKKCGTRTAEEKINENSRVEPNIIVQNKNNSSKDIIKIILIIIVVIFIIIFVLPILLLFAGFLFSGY